jgi:SAM-dependent methyltransferase
VLIDYDHGPPSPRAAGVHLERCDSVDSLSGRQFDLVLASAVLEHIPGARHELRRLLAALRPGGVLYARTPAVAPLLKWLQALHVSCDFTFPAHVHDLGPSFWSRILSHLELPATEYRIRRSGPSPVETSLRRNPGRTVAAWLLKAPGRVLAGRYPFCGGWEVFVERMTGS